MLEAFKGRLQNVQHDLTSGIQKLRSIQSPSFYGLSSSWGRNCMTPSASGPSLVDTEAGAQILHHYEQQWQLSEQVSLETSEMAVVCSSRLRQIEESGGGRAQVLLSFSDQLRSVPTLTQQLSRLVTLIANLQSLSDEVHSALAYLQVLVDIEAFEERKLDAKFSLVLEREAKIAEIRETKSEISEQKRRGILRQQASHKQLLYQKAFERDLRLYQRTNTLQRIAAAEQSDDLKDIILKETNDLSLNPKWREQIQWDNYAPIASDEEQLSLQQFLAVTENESTNEEGESASKSCT